MKHIAYLLLFIFLYSGYNSKAAPCSYTQSGNLSSTITFASIINCANGDVTLSNMSSHPSGSGKIVFDQDVTLNSLSIGFASGNKPVEFIINPGVTVTILNGLTFSGQPSKDKFLTVNGTLDVGGTLDFGSVEFEIDGTGTIEAADVIGATNTTCDGDGNCPGFTVDTCVEASGLCTETALPIELLFFEGDANKENVGLTWATATEENFDYFEIERASQGTSFEFVGEVEGNGDSFSRIEYDFTDDNPEIGLNYYRLKAIDLDGSSEYSDILLVKFTSNVKLIVSPNPTLGEISVKTSIPSTSSLVYEITNQYGVVVKSGVLSDFNTQIDLEGLTKGIYIIRLVDLPSVKAYRILLK